MEQETGKTFGQTLQSAMLNKENNHVMDMSIKQIIEQAIPLTDNCDIKRSAELKRRAKLRIDIEELLRDERSKHPYKPDLEYKGELPDIKLYEPNNHY